LIAGFKGPLKLRYYRWASVTRVTNVYGSWNGLFNRSRLFSLCMVLKSILLPK